MHRTIVGNRRVTSVFEKHTPGLKIYTPSYVWGFYKCLIKKLEKPSSNAATWMYFKSGLRIYVIAFSPVHVEQK